MLLKPYTVLDFTDDRGEIGPMLLGDLGADVIRVELKAGSASRRIEPLHPRDSSDLKSLSFRAFNRNKRSIVLDPLAQDDQAALSALIRRADFLFESWPASPLAAFNQQVDSVQAINPQIIHVRLSPFGDTGPYAELVANDLVIAAMGGPVALQGDEDRAPLRLSVPQVWRHAGVEAAAGAMAAFHKRLHSGQGQFVDVSAQCVMTWTMLNAMDAAAIQGFDFERSGGKFNAGATRFSIIHPTTDGHIVAIPSSQVILGCLPWMIEDGVAQPELADLDWEAYDQNLSNPDHSPLNVYQGVELCQAFFRLHTKQELFEFGLANNITLAPVNTLRELLALTHMQSRAYWSDIDLGDQTDIQAPGLWAKSNIPVMSLRRPPPGLGEHSEEIRTELQESTATRTLNETFHAPDQDLQKLPFDGIHVADFAWVGVGPISAKYLADHGARVVRIESESRPDVLRGNVPFKDNEPGIDRSQFFGDFNTSKESITLDMKSPQAIDIAKEIIKKSDVMIESFAPGAITRMGLDYAQVRELNPQIIMISTCLMGQTGPAAQLAGYGYHAGAIAGFYEVIGWPDRAPNGPWVAYTDTIAPRFISILLAAALDHRRRTGEGCYMDVAQIETALHFLAPELLDLQVTGHGATRLGNRSRFAAPQGCYPCHGEDNWCAIAIDSHTQWQALCDVIGRGDLALAEHLTSAAGRIAAHDKIDEAISEWTKQHTAQEVMSQLQQVGVPAGRVQRSSDLLRDPQYQHRQFYREHEHTVMGRVPYAGHQYSIQGYNNGARGPAPALGQHSFEILSDYLGFDDTAIAEAYASGAVT